MLEFWRNPEFIRHRRAELRPARALTVAAIVVVVAVLVGLACWSSRQEEIANVRGMTASVDGAWSARLQQLEQENTRQIWLLLYRWLVGFQTVVLTFWSLFACAQSVSGERDRKTWDFQRTTRLKPAELLVGKLLGEPVLAYFAVLCAVPATLVAGLAGGVSLSSVVAVYFLLAVAALFLGLTGLCLSTVTESRTRGVGLIGALALYGFTFGAYGFRESGLPGLAGLSPVMLIFERIGVGNGAGWSRIEPVLFGHEIPWLLMCPLITASLSVWLVVMLVRNLKRDYEEIRPFSRWQAVGCATFLNFLIYALLKPGMPPGWFTDAKPLATFVVAMNGLILFLMGLATLTPQERLKVWRRKRDTGEAPFFADDGLPWPWLGLSAVVAYALMVWGLMAWNHALPLQSGTLRTAAIQLLVVLVFVARDVLFLQWCSLTRLRQPVVKGFLYLGLYYIAVGVLTTLAMNSSQDAGRWVMSLLTPASIFDPDVSGFGFPAATYAGLALQTGVVAGLVLVISSRLQRPLRMAAATA